MNNNPVGGENMIHDTSNWNNEEQLDSLRTVKPEVQHMIPINQKCVPHMDTVSPNGCKLQI